MTAADRATALTEALWPSATPWGADHRQAPLSGPAEAMLARLLPVVDRLCREAAAEALEEAVEELLEYTAHAAQEAREWEPDATRVAEWEAKAGGYYWSARVLRDRAAALAAARPATDAEQKVARVEALAESYEATTARRVALAERYRTAGRDVTADRFTVLAGESRHHADRIRAALTPTGGQA